ncbi:MAG: helix-turn-helix transcriptional regulator [Prevotella sp.]|nr:helix-turn-helix transcriptional regulator [Prevotella sp.]
MKDRIRKIMESQHMTQQTFAQFIQMSPASLSSIFNGRTKPTLNIIEAIKQKIPALSTDWLLFGRGPMYVDEVVQSDDTSFENVQGEPIDQMLNFDQVSPSPTGVLTTRNKNGVSNTPNNNEKILMKYFDKPQRQITEIRIFYDDQTWETFVPKK